MDLITHEVETAYKSAFGKLVSSLLKSFPQFEIKFAEHIVHDSFAAALVDCIGKGVTQKPVRWLFKDARHNALNKIKQQKNRSQYTNEIPVEVLSENFSESQLEDFNLRLLFASAHQDLSPKAQVVLTLKYAVNFKI